MSTKKYDFTDETKKIGELTLHRIITTEDIYKYPYSIPIPKGTLGGFIQSEKNLSRNGSCWVYDQATVLNDALVRDNAVVCSCAMVQDRAIVGDSARVSGNAVVRGSARVSDDATIGGFSIVDDFAEIGGKAVVVDGAHVGEFAIVSDNAVVRGNANVYGRTILMKDMCVYTSHDILTVGNVGSEDRTCTFAKNYVGQILVVCGCFTGTIDQFRKQVKKRHKKNIHARVYLALADVAELKIKGLVK